MEVVGERPPPPRLPSKTRMNHFNGEISLKQKIIVGSEDVPSKDAAFRTQKEPLTTSEVPQSAEKSPRTLAKFANGRGRRTEPKIITWAQTESSFGEASDSSLLSINSFYKSSDPEKEDDFIYQNVSNAGTNYIEHKLNGIINNNGTKEMMKNARNQSDSSFRVNGTPPNRQIEVHQTKNKTVVKISIKHNGSEKNEDQFRPVKIEHNHWSREGKPFSSLPEYTAPTVRDSPKSSYSGLYRDCDEEVEYENLSLRQENYRLSDDQVYANLNASDPECDQNYENQDFDSREDSRVAHGVTEKNTVRAGEARDEQIYENQIFDCDEKTYENFRVSHNEPEKTVVEGDRPFVRVNLKEHVQKAEVIQDKMKSRKVIVTINGLQSESDELKKMDYESQPGHKRAESLTSSGVGVDSESDGEGSNISCDSLNSNELNALSTSEDHGYHTPNSENKTGSPVDDYQNVYENAGEEIYENFPVFETQKKKQAPPPPPPKPKKSTDEEPKSLPKGLLRDIQSRSAKLSTTCPEEEQNREKDKVAELIPQNNPEARQPKVEEKTYEERKKEPKSGTVNRICAMDIDTDQFYKFHLFENKQEATVEKSANEEETFAGVKDYLNREKQAAIKSAKGTIRGVKNRVKAGIATFLQMQENKVSACTHISRP